MEKGMRVLGCSGRCLAWLFLAVGILALVPSIALSQRVLVEWNFPTNSADAIADGGIAANTNRQVAAGGGVGAVTYTNSSASGHSTLSARSSNWDDGDTNKYWAVELTTAGFRDIMLSSRQRSSSAGPKSFKVQCQVGDGEWTDTPGGEVTCADSWTSGVLSNLPLSGSCADQPLISVRWLMVGNVNLTNGAVARNAFNQIDDIILRGTRLSVPAPQALPSSGVSASQFTANWTPVADVTGYELDVATTSEFTSGEAGTSLVFDCEGTNETKTAYTSGVVNLSGVDWRLADVLIGTSSNDWKYGIRSARLRGYGTSAMTMQEDLTNGLGHIVFQYRRYSTDVQEAWMVEYSTDSGGDWTQIGPVFTAPSMDEVQTFSNRVGVAGNARVRIRRVTGTGVSDRRLNIDNIALTSYIAGGYVPGYESRAVSGPGHVVEGLTKGTYYYRVRAVDSEIVSDHSNVIRVRASDTAPGLLLFVH